MNKKQFNFWTVISSIVWALFALGAWYSKMGLGTVATLGGIAIMFAWTYEQNNLTK